MLMTICCQQIKLNACPACWFPFHAAFKPTGIVEAVNLADILTLVSSFSLYFSPYSNTNTTKSATAKPGQVRAGLLLLMVPCNPVQPVAWSGSRQLNWLPHQFFSWWGGWRVTPQDEKQDLSKGGLAQREPTAIVQILARSCNPPRCVYRIV